MRYPAMVRIGDRTPVRGNVDVTLPTDQSLGEWSVEVEGEDGADVFLAREQVSVEMVTPFQTFFGLALPTRFEQPLGGKHTLTLIGNGELLEVERRG